MGRQLISRGLVVAAVLWAAGGATQALAEPQPGGPVAKIHQEQAGVRDSTGWYRVRSTGGGFVVTTPVPCADLTMTMPTQQGTMNQMHLLRADTPQGVKYAAMAGQMALGKSVDDLVKSFESKGLLKSRRAVQMAGRRGVEFVVGQGSMSARFRAVEVRGTFYQLSVEYPASAEAAMAADVDRFMDSFSLK